MFNTNVRCAFLCALLPLLSLFVLPTMASASPAWYGSPGTYQLNNVFHVPVPSDALHNGWCYDTATVDPETHVLYLADNANAQITVINPASGKVTGIGTGQFTGIGGCHSYTYSKGGPEGAAIHKEKLIAGNGNSHVLFFNKESGTRLADAHTGGSLRADEMVIAQGNLIVTNPDEVPHPYITFIDLQTYTIKARFVFTDATGGLEQPQYWAGHLFISVPTTAGSPNGGEVDELDISHLEHIHIMHRFAFATCQPGGLSIRGDGIAAVGCGGLKNTSQVILNLNNGHQTMVRGISGVDIVDVYRGDFFWVSYATAQFFISDVHGRILQTFPATHASHTVTVDTSNGDVWVPQDKGDVNLYTPVNEWES